MVHLSTYPPPGAPSCWGSKYQDGDAECGQCKFNDTCRQEVMRQVVAQPLRPPIPPVPVNNYSVPLPKTPFLPPYRPGVPAPPQIPAPVFAPQPPPVAYQQQAPYQPPPQYMLPLSPPNPAAPWQRPGVASPAYYFTQYEGETITQRLAKNLVLRAGRGIFEELAFFFTHWTWPPVRS